MAGDFGARTEWLGDAYQRHYRKDPGGPVKQLALVQSPGFVSAFLLERTLDPAVREFGLGGVRVIDPCCGTGHVLCRAFDRLWPLWADARPDLGPVERAARVLAQLHGVDLDPLCVALCRLRLTVAAADAACVLPYHGWGFERVVAERVVWGDALLPADHALQPYRGCRPELAPGYGAYRTRETLAGGAAREG